MQNGMMIKLPMPAAISGFKLPPGVRRRLELLLDRQDSGTPLTAAERREAEGLVEMAEFLSFIKLKAKSGADVASAGQDVRLEAVVRMTTLLTAPQDELRRPLAMMSWATEERVHSERYLPGTSCPLAD